jgi:hypothetical protein
MKLPVTAYTSTPMDVRAWLTGPATDSDNSRTMAEELDVEDASFSPRILDFDSFLSTVEDIHEAAGLANLYRRHDVIDYVDLANIDDSGGGGAGGLMILVHLSNGLRLASREHRPGDFTQRAGIDAAVDVVTYITAVVHTIYTKYRTACCDAVTPTASEGGL